MTHKIRTIWKIFGWYFLASVIIFSLTKTIPIPATIWDKVQHLVSYGWLMFWLSYTFTGPKSKLALRLILLGIGLECIQYLLPYRSFDLYDILANTLGVFIGWLVVSTPLKNLLTWLESLFTFKSKT